MIIKFVDVGIGWVSVNDTVGITDEASVESTVDNGVEVGKGPPNRTVVEVPDAAGVDTLKVSADVVGCHEENALEAAVVVTVGVVVAAGVVIASFRIDSARKDEVQSCRIVDD